MTPTPLARHSHLPRKRLTTYRPHRDNPGTTGPPPTPPAGPFPSPVMPTQRDADMPNRSSRTARPPALPRGRQGRSRRHLLPRCPRTRLPGRARPRAARRLKQAVAASAFCTPGNLPPCWAVAPSPNTTRASGQAQRSPSGSRPAPMSARHGEAAARLRRYPDAGRVDSTSLAQACAGARPAHPTSKLAARPAHPIPEPP